MSPAPTLPLLDEEFLSADDLQALCSPNDRGDTHAVRQGALLHTDEGLGGNLVDLEARANLGCVLLEAVRILGTVTGDTDPYGYIGRVETLGALVKRGFVINAQRCGLGRQAYEIQHGYLLEAVAATSRRGDPDESGGNPAVRTDQP